MHHITWYLVCLTISSVFVALGWINWPGLHWDACYFSTPVLNVADGTGWLFGAYTPALVRNPTQKYLSHGFLHILFYGSFLKASTWADYMTACGLINAASFSAWAWLSQRYLGKLSLMNQVRSVMFGVVAGVIAIGLQGRPEHLGILIIAFPLILRKLGLSKKCFRLLMCALAGVLYCLSPASGLLMGMALIYWISMRDRGVSSVTMLFEYTLSGMLAIFTSYVLISVCGPTNVVDWVRGNLESSETALDLSSLLFTLDFKILKGHSLDAPLWNLLVIGSFVLICIDMWLRRAHVGLAVFVSLSAFSMPKLTDYGFAEFFPLIFLYWSTRATPVDRLIPVSRVLNLGNAFTVLAACYCLMFTRTSLLGWMYFTEGISLAATQERVSHLIQSIAGTDQLVVFHSVCRPSFVVAGHGGVVLISGMAHRSPDEPLDDSLVEFEKSWGKKVMYFIYPQTHFGTSSETIFFGKSKLVKIYDGWSDKRPTFLGLRLGGPFPGYQFALYRRVE